MARPAIAPVAIPTKLGFPNFIHSIRIQTRHAVDAEMWVTAIAMPAPPLAPNALPPLKPNQPTHSIAAPIITIPGLCGGLRSFGNPLRLPNIAAITSAATPAFACTTNPPAKSIVPRPLREALIHPRSDRSPPPQIQ